MISTLLRGIKDLLDRKLFADCLHSYLHAAGLEATTSFYPSQQTTSTWC